MLTEQDHRWVAVRAWANEGGEVFNALLGLELRETDLSDDRLAVVLDKIGYEQIQGLIDAEMVREWVTYDWLRVAMGAVGFVSAIRAISVPFPAPPDSRAAPGGK